MSEAYKRNPDKVPTFSVLQYRNLYTCSAVAAEGTKL
jgi:hypothetical protein